MPYHFHPITLAEIAFDPIGQSWLAFSVFAISLLVTPLWKWYSSSRSATHNIVAALRMAAAFVMAILLLRPAWVQTSTETTNSLLTIALDQSLSMSLPDRDDRSRFETQQNSAAELLDILKRRAINGLSIRTVGYGQSVRELEFSKQMGTAPTDAETNFVDVLRQVEQDTQTSAGLVLFGDGTRTSKLEPSGADSLTQSVRALASSGVGIYTVPLGPSDLESPVDVSIESLPESYQLFAGNIVDVQFVVETSGITTGEVDVDLQWVTEEGGIIPIAERRLVPTQPEQSVAMSIPVQVPPPGIYQLRVSSPAKAGESVVTNNRQIAFAEVRDGGGHVLYLEGQSRLEQIFLRRSIARFPDLDLTYQLIPSSSRPSWPINLSEQIDLDRFDAVIIGDLSSASVSDANWKTIADRVGEGMGLITLGGLSSYEAGDYQNSPIADLFPFKFASRSSQPIKQPVSLLPAEPHPISRMGDNTLEQWQNSASMLGANRLGDLKPLPGVKLVLQDSDDHPMLIVGEFGRGRVASLAFDSTWRWWRSGDDKLHRRFWRQLLLWTLDRSIEDDVISIEMETRRIAVGEKVNFSATVESTGGLEIPLVARLINRSTPQTAIAPSAIQTNGRADGIGGSIGPLPPGIYRLVVEAGGNLENDSGAAIPQPAGVAFEVIDRQIELERPKPDSELLQQISAMTSRNGGRAHEASDMIQLADEIEKRQRALIIPRQTRRRLGEDAFSAWILFGCLALTTTSQWILRRRWALQ